MARKPLKLAKPPKAPKAVKPVKAPARKPKSRFADGGYVDVDLNQYYPQARYSSRSETNAAAQRVREALERDPANPQYRELAEIRQAVQGGAAYSQLSDEQQRRLLREHGNVLKEIGMSNILNDVKADRNRRLDQAVVTNAENEWRRAAADPVNNPQWVIDMARQTYEFKKNLQDPEFERALHQANAQKRTARPQQQQQQQPRVAIPQQQVRATPSFVQQQNAALQAALARRPQTFGIGMGSPRQPPMNMRPQPQMPQQAGPMQQGQPGGIGAMGMPGSFFKKGGKVSAKKPAAKSKRK